MEKVRVFKKNLVILFATFFYLGYSPIASGTAGSLGALLLVWLLGTSQAFVFPGIAALLFFLGVYASSVIQKETGIADHGIIVIDEVVGIFLTFTFIQITPLNLCLGFFLFRFFDIFKLPPASTVDRRLKNGWGVMLDDVFAGVYANLSLQVLIKCVSA